MPDMLRRYAETIRAEWAEYVREWEADTEPGYPLQGATAKWRDLGLAIADAADAIADGLDDTVKRLRRFC